MKIEIDRVEYQIGEIATLLKITFSRNHEKIIQLGPKVTIIKNHWDGMGSVVKVRDNETGREFYTFTKFLNRKHEPRQEQ